MRSARFSEFGQVWVAIWPFVTLSMRLTEGPIRAHLIWYREIDRLPFATPFRNVCLHILGTYLSEIAARMCSRFSVASMSTISCLSCWSTHLPNSNPMHNQCLTNVINMYMYICSKETRVDRDVGTYLHQCQCYDVFWFTYDDEHVAGDMSKTLYLLIDICRGTQYLTV